MLSAGATLRLWPAVNSGERVAAGSQLRAAVDAAGRAGDLWKLASARLQLMWFKYTSRTALVPGVTLTLFILGLLALRHGVFDEPRARTRLIASWMAYGFAWAVYWLILFRIPLFPFRSLDWQLRYGFGLLNEQWLCLTWIGAPILLLEYRPVWRQRLGWLGSADGWR